MIKGSSISGEVDVKVKGTKSTILAELVCLVDQVVEAITEDEPEQLGYLTKVAFMAKVEEVIFK